VPIVEGVPDGLLHFGSVLPASLTLETERLIDDITDRRRDVRRNKCQRKRMIRHRRK
jgi:hypothetical protein